MSDKITLATLWLDGCSGCHMSFLDLDQRLIELAEKVEVVYSPLVDYKEFPEQVDVTIIEGAIGSHEDKERLMMIRQHTKVLIALGDCAVTGNVPAMRNYFPLSEVLEQSYLDPRNVNENPSIPDTDIPELMEQSTPLNAIVSIDAFIPGCPPHADTIYHYMTCLLEGKEPDSSITHFGA